MITYMYVCMYRPLYTCTIISVKINRMTRHDIDIANAVV